MENEMADRNYIMNTPTYIGEDLVLPEDREYLEGFMNRYYPNHFSDSVANGKYAQEMRDKQMESLGYKKNPEYGYDASDGSWASGPSGGIDKDEYWKAKSAFTKERRNTLQNEVNRKYPDWPEDYRNRVTDDVFSKWNNNINDYGPDYYKNKDKQTTQNITNAVQGVM